MRAFATSLVLLFGSLLLGQSQVFAQAVPETTGDPNKRAPELKTPAKSDDSAAGPRKTAPPPGASEMALTVTEFVFSGNTVFTSEQLSNWIQSYTNRPIKLSNVFEAADKITEFYYKQGYTLASVTVPAQKISNGAVRLEVIEGRIADVKLEGASRYSEKQVTENLGAFRSGQIYRGEDLDSGLFRLNSLPGLTARAVLQAGADYGTSDLLVKLDEKPFVISAAADNYGRDDLGEIRASLSAGLNNPFRLEDQLQLVALGTEGGLMRHFYVGYSVPFWSGSRFSVSYGDGRFELEKNDPSDPQVDGKNQRTRVGIDQWFVDRRSDTFSAGLAYVRTDANADLAGNPISDTEITNIELSAFYRHTFENFAATQFSVVLADIDANTIAYGDESALRTQLDLQHVQPIYGRLSGYLKGNYVTSADPLPSVTKASIGGPNSVRGYRSADLRGDRSTFASAGLRQGLRMGRVDTGLRVFIDTGSVKQLEDPDRGLTAYSESLTSAGVGIDFEWLVGERTNVKLKADYSKALGDPPNAIPNDPSTELDDSQFYATISVGY